VPLMWMFILFAKMNFGFASGSNSTVTFS
jgi:hypothetical protein